MTTATPAQLAAVAEIAAILDDVARLTGATSTGNAWRDRILAEISAGIAAAAVDVRSLRQVDEVAP